MFGYSVYEQRCHIPLSLKFKIPELQATMSTASVIIVGAGIGKKQVLAERESGEDMETIWKSDVI